MIQSMPYHSLYRITSPRCFWRESQKNIIIFFVFLHEKEFLAQNLWIFSPHVLHFIKTRQLKEIQILKRQTREISFFVTQYPPPPSVLWFMGWKGFDDRFVFAYIIDYENRPKLFHTARSGFLLLDNRQLLPDCCINGVYRRHSVLTLHYANRLCPICCIARSHDYLSKSLLRST
jgi:hypothetical protein